jgi:hypothetical protein
MIIAYSAVDKPKYPMPNILAHIKIVHLLSDKPHLVVKPDVIARKVKLNPESVMIYLSQLKKQKARNDDD